MANIEATQAAILIAAQRASAGVQATQAAIIMAVRRYPLQGNLNASPPNQCSRSALPRRAVLS